MRFSTPALCIVVLFMGLRTTATACDPACSDPDMCRLDDPRGTCCCPYPIDAYPSVGNPPYHVLDAYRLSGEQEAAFDETDGLPSSFWSAWDADGGMDYVQMNPLYPGNAWNRSDEGFIGESDAQALVRAAWSDRGLYLYVQVVDDQFVDDALVCIKEYCPNDPSELSWANDAMDLYLDIYSTDLHEAAPDMVFANPTRNRLTKKTIQIQYQFGSATTKDRFSFNRADPLTADLIIDRNVTFADAKANYDGLTGEAVTLNDFTKAQEWFIPWSYVGNGGIPTPNPGTSFAFTVGYNDADGGATDMDCLRWRNAADPTKRIQDLATGLTEHVPTEPWGDIQVVADPVGDAAIRFRPSARQPHQSDIVSVGRFDLRGARVGRDDVRAAATAVHVERMRLKDGTTRTGLVVR